MTSAIPRDVLPIPDRPYVGPTMYDATDPNARYAPIKPVRPPEGAPNILLVLLDDAGFGSNSAFGGPCRTPTFERLAANGLRYTRFHTTAICSPASCFGSRSSSRQGRPGTSAWRPVEGCSGSEARLDLLRRGVAQTLQQGHGLALMNPESIGRAHVTLSPCRTWYFTWGKSAPTRS